MTSYIVLGGAAMLIAAWFTFTTKEEIRGYKEGGTYEDRN